MQKRVRGKKLLSLYPKLCTKLKNRTFFLLDLWKKCVPHLERKVRKEHVYNNKCNDSKLIPNFYLCDGIRDCTYGDDEDNVLCSGLKCTDNGFFCQEKFVDHYCLKENVEFCNKIADCLDMSDEDPRLCGSDECPENFCLFDGECKIKNGLPSCSCAGGRSGKRCQRSTRPPQPKFKAVDFACKESDASIPYFRVCDGFNDCPEGEDEATVTCGNVKCSSAVSGSEETSGFFCRYGEDKFCLNHGDKYCDEIKNCINGADEDHRLCASAKCPTDFCLFTKTCEVKDKLPQCSCPSPRSGKRCQFYYELPTTSTAAPISTLKGKGKSRKVGLMATLVVMGALLLGGFIYLGRKKNFWRTLGHDQQQLTFTPRYDANLKEVTLMDDSVGAERVETIKEEEKEEIGVNEKK